jgi:hypothetical protein
VTADLETEGQVNTSSNEHNRGDSSANGTTNGKRPVIPTYVAREIVGRQYRVLFFNEDRAARVIFGRCIHPEVEHNRLLRSGLAMPYRAIHRKDRKGAWGGLLLSLSSTLAAEKAAAGGVGRNGPFIFKFKPMMARTVGREQKSHGVSIKRSLLWASPCFRHGPFS